jgi:serine/threonine-protein kinase
VANQRVIRFGKYELIAHLATGGMAEIFLARQTGIAGFEKVLVIKKILPHLGREEVFVQMFLDEARIAARLNHQNVVQIFDLGCVEGQYFIAMEYLEGESLAEVVRQARRSRQNLPSMLAAGIAMQVCEGLHYAHTLVGPDGDPMQVVHRDVNPQNVFVLYSGGVKLVDFGIAKAAKRFSKTTTGMLKGKYGYMSPEQIMSKSLDARSDVYSSGVVLWEMLTSRKLFRQSSELEILKAITEKDTPPPSSVVSSLPEELDEITMKALKRSRELRYQSSGEMRMELSFMLRRKAEQSDTVAIGEYMQAMFYDRMQEKRRLIKSAQSAGANLEEALFGDLRFVKDDTEPSISPDTPPFGHTPPTVKEHPDQQSTVASAPSRFKLLAFLTGLGLLAVLAVVFLVLPAGRKLVGLDREPVEPPKTPVTTEVKQEKKSPLDAGTTMVGTRRVPEPATPEIPKAKRPPKRRRQKVRKQKSTPTPAKDLEPGRLRLATNPWTTVFFEGKKLGVTPLVDVKLPPGKHVLRATNPGKGIDGRITVEIRPGETTSKSVSF